MGATAPSTSTSSHLVGAPVKRKATGSDPFNGLTTSDNLAHNRQELAPRPEKRSKRSKTDGEIPAEKRLRKYRANPPKAFDDVYLRARTQKFFVLSRTRCGTLQCPEEVIELTGSTGNIYNVVIAQQPGCDCPHAAAGNQCKHVLFVLSRVLRAKFEHVYQLALLSTELQEIFANAPPPLDPNAEARKDDKRKTVEGDCPICFDTMDPNNGEAIVWCRAACGQNIHSSCFQTWATTKRQQGSGDVTCPYCRSVWEGDDDMIGKIKSNGRVNSEGYVNVAGQLGISTERDYSTYSRFWSGHPQAYRRRGRNQENDDEYYY